jgi:hypothetical protein
MNKLSPLKQWIFTNKYFIKSSENKEKKASATHYLLDGGIWKVPLEKYQEFLQLLSVDLQNNEKHYISENRTPVFRFICDLDFFEPSPISLKQIETLVSFIQEHIYEYFGIDKNVIICSSDCKVISPESIKSGFHLVWPDIWITQQTAKSFRLLLIPLLVEKFGMRSPENSWEDVIDLAVYEDNGLRMIGCRKMGICKSCKNKKEFRETCETCDTVGKIDENRVYRPVCIIPENIDYLKILQSDYYTTLSQTSIYNYQSFEETVLVKSIPVLNQSVKKKQVREATPDDILTTKLENLIKKNYFKTVIKKITKTNDLSYFVESENNFCINVNRNHTSSGVYFHIRPSGICQRCYCKKTTLDGRQFGPCPQFASPEIPISKQLQTFLFGETVVVKKKGKSKQLINFSISRNGSTSSLDNLTLQNNDSSSLSNRRRCIKNCENILQYLENQLT